MNAEISRLGTRLRVYKSLATISIQMNVGSVICLKVALLIPLQPKGWRSADALPQGAWPLRDKAVSVPACVVRPTDEGKPRSIYALIEGKVHFRFRFMGEWYTSAR